MSSVVYRGPRCPHCANDLSLDAVFSGRQSCPRCAGSFEAMRFTPPERSARIARVADAGPAGASPCGVHPANASVASCDRCGVFMCSLCRIDVEGASLCPGCFERLTEEGALKTTQATRLSYHRLAVITMLGGVLFCFWVMSLPCGIGAAYLCVRELRRKREMEETDGRLAVWTTLVLAVVQAVAGIAFLGLMVFGFLQE